MSGLPQPKSTAVAEHLEQRSEKEQEIVEIKVITGSDAYAEALIKEPPKILESTTIRLIGCLLLGCFCQTMNGFDGGLFNGLMTNQHFLNFFNGQSSGVWAAYNAAMYQIGGVCALPFVGPAIDTWGRRVGMSIGAWIIIIGAIINGTTVYDGDLGQLKAGRFVLGFGVSIVSAAGPIYVVETAHPAWRGVITAYCNTFWFIGAILSAGACLGALPMGGTISWQIPIWLQLVFPGLIVLFVWFIPESPRWLYVHNKRQKAVEILTKWHGLGRPESVWVRLQLDEYEEYLNTNGAVCSLPLLFALVSAIGSAVCQVLIVAQDRRWWDYRALFRTRASCYRIACNCVFSIFGQWAGNGALTYFIAAVLTTAGYTDGHTQATINLAYQCFQYFFALCGASLVERVGRRPLMICSMAGCCLVWIGATIASSYVQASDYTNVDASRATVAMIFIFGAVYSIGITPLQALYPVEVLSYEMRAKGMAFSALAVNAGGLLNQFAWPISLKRIGWKTYIVYTVWCGIQAAVFYFMMPETRKRTLEELDRIFEARNPVKASLAAREIAVDADGTIVASEVNPVIDAKV